MAVTKKGEVDVEGEQEANRRSFLHRVMLTALAAVILGAVIAVPIVWPSRPASALEVVQKAARDFAHAPPFRGTMKGPVTPAETSDTADLFDTIRVSHRSAPTEAVRLDYVSTGPVPEEALGGSVFRMVVGNRFFEYDGATGERARHVRLESGKPANLFDSRLPANVEGFPELFLQSIFQKWERACRNGESNVLPDEVVAGRTAHHIRCGVLSRPAAPDDEDRPREVWIDARTGVILKAKDGIPTFGIGDGTIDFALETIDYGPLPPETFAEKAPPGARDLDSRRAAAVATLESIGPFKLTIRKLYWVHPDLDQTEDAPEIQKVSYRTAQAVRANQESEWDSERGPAVFFNGWCGARPSLAGLYDPGAPVDEIAADPPPALAECGPVAGALGALLPDLRNQRFVQDAIHGLTWRDFLERDCRALGPTTVAGRPARHFSCGTAKAARHVWLDEATGLVLKEISPDHSTPYRSFEVVSFEPDPEFFDDFAPLSADSHAFALLSLRRGDVAPAWNAKTIDGRTISLGGKHGRPSIVLVQPCGVPFSTTSVILDCDRTEFQRAYERWRGRVDFVWVLGSSEIGGPSDEDAGWVARNAGYSFPIVSTESKLPPWFSEDVDVPFVYVLLDADGRVIGARDWVQTVKDLDEWLKSAARES